MPPPTIPKKGGPQNFQSSTFRRGIAYIKGGMGKGKTALGGGANRQRKLKKDCIYGITKPAIRRLARRGGVKRISGTIYDDIRSVMKDRLKLILSDCVAYVEYRRTKTITVNDVLFSLRRIGQPLYGFDPETNTDPKKSKY